MDKMNEELASVIGDFERAVNVEALRLAKRNGKRLGLYHHLLVGQAGKSFIVGTLRVVFSGCGCVLRLRPSRFPIFSTFVVIAIARRVAFVPLFSSSPSSSLPCYLWPLFSFSRR